jgi:hypothetical protein
MYQLFETLPIVYSGTWEQLYDFVVLLHDVRFTKDFNDIKNGQTFNSISIDLENGILCAYDTDDLEKPAHKIIIELSPTNIN